MPHTTADSRGGRGRRGSARRRAGRCCPPAGSASQSSSPAVSNTESAEQPVAVVQLHRSRRAARRPRAATKPSPTFFGALRSSGTSRPAPRRVGDGLAPHLRKARPALPSSAGSRRRRSRRTRTGGPAAVRRRAGRGAGACPVASSKNSRSRTSSDPERRITSPSSRAGRRPSRVLHREPVLAGRGPAPTPFGAPDQSSRQPDSVFSMRRVPALTSRSSPMCSTPSSRLTETVRSCQLAAVDPLHDDRAVELVAGRGGVGAVEQGRGPCPLSSACSAVRAGHEHDGARHGERSAARRSATRRLIGRASRGSGDGRELRDRLLGHRGARRRGC